MYLAGSQGRNPGQLQLLMVNLQPLGPPSNVPLAQFAALLILDGREHPEGPVLTCQATVVLRRIHRVSEICAVRKGDAAPACLAVAQ